MITFIPPDFTGPVWKRIELGANASIEIAIKRPTLGEQLSVLEETRGDSLQAFLLRSRIVDWRGVNDPTGQPVPYSWNTLSLLCVSYPDAIWDLLSAVRTVLTTGSDEQKNFKSPSLAGGTDEKTAASTTESSTSTTTCGESAVCVEHSD